MKAHALGVKAQLVRQGEGEEGCIYQRRNLVFATTGGHRGPVAGQRQGDGWRPSGSGPAAAPQPGLAPASDRAIERGGVRRGLAGYLARDRRRVINERPIISTILRADVLREPPRLVAA